MGKTKKSIVVVQGTEIAIMSHEQGDYISLTDMLKAKDGEFFISDWLRNRNTVEFLGIWERIYSPDFNYGEFAVIRSQAGLNSYKISVKEGQQDSCHRLESSRRTIRGTYAHKDIALNSACGLVPNSRYTS